MGRVFIDCREVSSDKKCSLAMAADSEQELLDAAVRHAVDMHGHKDTPELRATIRSAFRKGTPPITAPSHAA